MKQGHLRAVKRVGIGNHTLGPGDISKGYISVTVHLVQMKDGGYVIEVPPLIRADLGNVAKPRCFNTRHGPKAQAELQSQ